MAFRDLIHQDHAVMLLRTAVRTGRIAHAYLFAGPAGVGRREAALAFAQLLNCERPTGADACGECASCRLIATGQHPDVRTIDVERGKVLDPEDTTKTAVGLKQVLALRREVVYPPYQGRWKVYLIADSETLTNEAANSLLKVLEEPPPQVVIILIAEAVNALLPTVVSRCQLLRFSFIPTAAIEQALVDRFSLPRGRARFLAALADGRLGRAAAWATSGDALQLRESVLDLLGHMAGADALERLDAAETLAKEKETAAEVLEIALLWYRDLLVWQHTQNESLLINVDRIDAIKTQALEVPSAVLSQWVDAVDDAKDALRRNVHPRLVLETLFLRLVLPPTPVTP